MPNSASCFYTFPSGRQIELFYIKTLADELGREVQTIRKWEISNIIPDPIFKDKNKKRLYTREQIDVIVRAAFDSGLAPGKAISRTTFSKRVHKAMNVLKERYKVELHYKGESALK